MAAPMQQQQPACLIMDCTKSLCRPDGSASSMLPHEKHCHPKCHRDQSAYEEIEHQPSSKRRKAALHNYPPEFWNALWKIVLSHSALKEFDRRTTKKTTPVVGAAKKSTRLLRSDTKKLLQFAKNGGPNLNHLRGYANQQQAAARMSNIPDSGPLSSDPTPKTRATGPYDAQFQQMLIQKSVYPEGHRLADGSEPPKPSNVASIMECMQRPRSSMPPSQFSQTAFKDFQDRNRRASSESECISELINIVAGQDDFLHETSRDIVFNNLEKFDPNLKAPKPDKYYGACTVQIDLPVLRDLDYYIIPATARDLPAAPNFFLEAKSHAGTPVVAQRQVMHDNAYGARAMFMLQNYGKEKPTYDGNAYTIGLSYCDGQLKIYAMHPRQSASGMTEYHMTLLDGYAMTSNIDHFRLGILAYRNLRDFAREQRDRIISEANDTARPRKARPRKRMRLAASTGPRLRSSTRGPTPNAQASNTRIHDIEMTDGSNGHNDEEYVAADGEQDGDEDDVHAAIHGRSAQDAMAHLLKQGHSWEMAFDKLVMAHQQYKGISRQVAIGEVRAMLFAVSPY